MRAFATAAILGCTPPAFAGSFDECSTALRADPHSRSSARCFQKAVEAGADPTEAIRLLREAQGVHADAGWVSFHLAELLSRQQSPHALENYRRALKQFLARSDAAGEAEARIGAGMAALNAGRRDEAWAEGPLAIDAARRSGVSVLIARALLYDGWLAQRTGERLARGMRALREAEALVFPHGPYAYRSSVLGALGRIFFSLGRYDHSFEYYAKQVDLARQNHDEARAVTAAHSALTARRKQLEDLPEPGRLAELTAEARKLAALADTLARPALQATANRTLADLLAAVPETRAAAGTIYRTALQQARRGTDRAEISMALWALGRYLSDTSPAESRRLVNEALQRAVESGSGTAQAYAWRQQMRLAWTNDPRDKAVAVSLEALNVIEALRARQAPDVTRATVFGAWALDYHWLIGTLLQRPQRTPADVALAFDIGERMRARLLLDTLRRPSRDANASTPSEPLAVEPFASLEAVERSLRDNEAFLSFTLGLWTNVYGNFAGGAWLLVSTNKGTTVVRTSDRARLRPVLSIFRGLIEHRDEVDDGAAVKLHEELLGKAFAALPAAIDRLIVVPDAALHHLPFAALQRAPATAPLGLTHDIILVPSATVWQRSKPPERSTPPRALVFADPAPPEHPRSAAAAEERGWSSTALQVGRLPHSRREGGAILSHLGDGSRLLADVEATEASLKEDDLSPFDILHFATHSVVDEERPERSAVLLSPGPNGEDGLLEPSEIADLPLSGKIVVLASCRSATGAVLAGEGVIGLSHAFLQAGARTVVGTLWPIRDDHAAAFFNAFYESLGRGHDVASALTEARRHAISHGMPASAWSSVVVVGDGSARFPASAKERSSRPTFAAVALLVSISVAVAVASLRLRRARER